MPYERYDIPYEGKYLNCIRIKAIEEKAIVVVCGGYDSFIEEFVLNINKLIESGYTVILFEGPGQWRSLEQKMFFIHNWEKPTGKVLDYFNIDSCVMIGISWGGYLALRSAAYEKRIYAAVAYNVMYDGLEVMMNVFPLVIATVLMICIFTTIATLPAVYEAIYQISPSTAQFFKPIQKSCEDNGIKMQVEAAYIHDNIAEIYITMQDLTGEHIDETTDLFDSYSINRPFSSVAGCVRVGYDDKTKTATFLITISEFGTEKIIGKKLTFSVKEFLSGKHYYNSIPIDTDLSLLDNDVTTQLVRITGGGGINYGKYMPDFEDMDYDYKVKVLSATNSIDFPVDGIEVTAMGYVDGMFHVQTATKDKETTDNHGFIYLKDKNVNNIQCDYNVAFRENINSKNRIDYDEYVFDIPQSEIGQYFLYGDFVINGLFTQGNWEVTFPIEEEKNN